MTRAYWLLEVQIDGRTYRWSTEAVSVTTADGDVLEYHAGIVGDLTLAQGDEPAVSIVDPAVDWPTLAPELEGASAVVLRWLEGTTYEAAIGYATGRAVGVEYGDRTEPVSFAVEVEGPTALGVPLPDPLTRIDGQTWPISPAHVPANEGAYYPIIFGYPGFRGTVPANEPPAYPVVPVPVAEWGPYGSPSHATVIVCEDLDSEISAVWLYNADNGGAATYSTISPTDSSPPTDRLGLISRQIRIVDPDMLYPTQQEAHFYAGFSSASGYGGGAARTAYEVIAYMLRRWGIESIDWTRLPEVKDVLAPYQVDTWIDDAVSDPWAWLEAAILPDLPVEVRVSRLGRYLVHKRYVSDSSRQVGSISADAGDATRLGPVRRDEVAPLNQLEAVYRAGRDGAWLGRLILTGDPTLIIPASQASALTDATDTEAISVARSARCLASHSRYGPRLALGGPREIDWTWDEGTVLRVLEDVAAREALPARLVDYLVEDGEDLEEGDEVLLTDSAIGLSAHPAIVEAPPVRSSLTTTCTFRLPEEG